MTELMLVSRLRMLIKHEANVIWSVVVWICSVFNIDN